MLSYVWSSCALLALVAASPVPIVSKRSELAGRQTPLNAFLDTLLNSIPVIDGTLDTVASSLTTFEVLLAALTGEKTTYNDLNGPCKPYTVVFARGTTEPGNVGILAGPPFFDALREKLGSANVAVQGVNNYHANIDGYLEGGEASGSQSMATQIEQVYAKCPNTKLVASGYSQGGQLVHNAAALLPAKVGSWISSIVIFGDPDNGQAIANVPSTQVATYCNVSDNICENGILILPAHLLYGLNAEAAAAFVAAH